MLGALILFDTVTCTWQTYPTAFNATDFVKRSLIYLVEGHL